jgi:uncharacterized protein (TIGR03086 family)
VSLVAVRFRKVAGRFTAVVNGVPDDAWDAPSPCEGWSARDVVRHLVEWVPPFLHAGAGLELPEGPSVDEDPAGAWAALREGLQALLDDAALAEHPFEHEQVGSHPLDRAIALFVLGDVLIHTWDLARATDQDPDLDRDEVTTMLDGMEPVADTLVASGHYAPPVEVSPDADPETRLIALTGRTP